MGIRLSILLFLIFMAGLIAFLPGCQGMTGERNELEGITPESAHGEGQAAESLFSLPAEDVLLGEAGGGGEKPAEPAKEADGEKEGTAGSLNGQGSGKLSQHSRERTPEIPGGNDQALPQAKPARGSEMPDERNSGRFVELWVTRDFGSEVLFSGSLEILPGQSVMSLLKNYLQVDTEYGGRFVRSLEGLASGFLETEGGEGRADWFYYVNGVAAGVGAAEYFPSPGDIIWWDYHLWESSFFTPAVIGAFPQPFLSGYNKNNPGTLILAGDGLSELAEKVADFFREKGVSAEVEPYEEKKVADRLRITLVIAPWEQLQGSRFWQGMQKYRQKSGWFVELEDNTIYVLNARGERRKSFQDSAGVILATGSGLGDPAPLWLLTGLKMEGVGQAVETLLERPYELKEKFALLVAGEEVIELPLR